MLQGKQTKTKHDNNSKTTQTWCFFPTLGRADIQYLLFTGSTTITDEMEFCGRFPCSLRRPSFTAPPAPVPSWHSPSLGIATPAWHRATSSVSPHLTPLQLQPWEEAATEGRKQKYLPVLLLPSATEPHGCPRHSMNQAVNVATLKDLHWSLRTKPTCCLAVDHGIYPGEVHSFSGPQSPSQGPPNPVRHLLSRWASGAFWQGFASPPLTLGPPLGLGCGRGRGRILTELSPSSFPPAAIFPLKKQCNDQWLWRCLWYCVHLVFSEAVRKEL